MGRKFGYFTAYQVCPSGGVGCLYQTSGSNDDWIYGELGVAAYTFELGIQFFESCSYFEDSVLDKNIKALLYAFKSVHNVSFRPLLTFSSTLVSILESMCCDACLADLNKMTWARITLRVREGGKEEADQL